MLEFEKTNPSINYSYEQLVEDDKVLFTNKTSFSLSRASAINPPTRLSDQISIESLTKSQANPWAFF